MDWTRFKPGLNQGLTRLGPKLDLDWTRIGLDQDLTRLGPGSDQDWTGMGPRLSVNFWARQQGGFFGWILGYLLIIGWRGILNDPSIGGSLHQSCLGVEILNGSHYPLDAGINGSLDGSKDRWMDQQRKGSFAEDGAKILR